MKLCDRAGCAHRDPHWNAAEFWVASLEMIRWICTSRRMLAVAIPVLAAVAGTVDILAQSMSPALDPVCGAPRLELKGLLPEEVYEIRASDDLGSPGVWERLVRLAPGTGSHQWTDPSALAQGRRFYRLEREEFSPEPQAPNFALLDQRGVRRELFREGDASVVVLVFTDNEHLGDTRSAVQPLQDAFQAQGVRFWFVNSRNSREEIRQATVGLPIPVLHDGAQIVARAFSATSLGEVVAISQLDLTPIYRGAIEDRCATPGEPVVQPYLKDALNRFLNGQPVSILSARPQGASLALRTLEVPRYSTDIAPLLQAKCVICHRPGDIGSFPMTNHASVARSSEPIRRQVLTGQMPPWHADPAYARFANDSSLTTDEIQRLVAWLDAGSPRGEGEDPLESHPPAPVASWPLGTPDLVLSIPAQSLPATGEIPYRYLIVNNPLRTTVWLRAAAVRPGNREVVHHCLVFTAKTVADFLQVQGGLGGFFAGYVPGAEPVEFPAGTGKQLKAGSYLVFQMHYTPNGSATTDQTEIGLYFAPAPPAGELVTTAAYDTGFTIPAGARDHEVVAETTLDRASVLYEMSPHMHFRGSRMRFEAVYPDGTQEVLLNVPGYEFQWQTLYRLQTPKRLPAGTRIRVVGGFDNSVWNPWNPDPLQSVTFGEQTSDEMLIGYLNLAAE